MIQRKLEKVIFLEDRRLLQQNLWLESHERILGNFIDQYLQEQIFSNFDEVLYHSQNVGASLNPHSRDHGMPCKDHIIKLSIILSRNLYTQLCQQPWFSAKLFDRQQLYQFCWIRGYFGRLF